MNRLRRLCCVLFASALALGAGIASAQSLAEVAKKEKERRDKNKEESKRVITDRELSTGYGGLPATSASRSSISSEDGSASGGEADEGAGAEEQQDETQTQEYWQNRVKGTKEKIARLEEQLASEDWGEGQRANVDPRGFNNLERRQQAEQELAAARAELGAIQEEARRAGVPPGWVR